jgi:Zn-dependent peptidase ImmA (M78 family)
VGRFEWAKLYGMKKTWGVSVSAILRRAKDLGLIDQTLYYRGNVYLSKTGQRKKELYDELVPEERPSLLRAAIALYEKDRARKGTLADAMQISANMLRRLVGEEISTTAVAAGDSAVVSIGEFRGKRQSTN